MARAKPSAEDVELAKIKARLKTAEKICDTILWCFLATAATAWVGIIAWAAVRISDRPSWVTVVMAILGFGAPPSVVAWRVIIRLKRQVQPDQTATESGMGDTDPATDQGVSP